MVGKETNDAVEGVLAVTYSEPSVDVVGPLLAIPSVDWV